MPYRNPLIDFLRAYGPSEAANNLFDEHVVNAAERYGVAPFHVHNTLIDDLAANFNAEAPKNVVLTGTAGDGKTYLCRQLYKHLGGSDADFRAEGEIKRIRTANGKRLTIIKDLSELREADKEAQLEVVTRAFLGTEPDDLFLLAANDGQLLKFWRDFVDRHPDADQVFESIRWMLKEERKAHDNLPGLWLENLSRQPNAELFERVIDTVLEHPAWASCTGCPAATQTPACPILENRDRLRGLDDATFRRRLKESIALAAANDLHLPMRQLFLLVSNILLGDSQSHGLLTCQKAQNRRHDENYAATNPYDNALGLNLTQSYRDRYAAFTTLSSFGVGQETNNTVDTLLLDAAPPAWHASCVANDPLYGAPLLEAERQAYRRGDSAHYDDLLTRMEAQRRRLFFTLPEASVTPHLDPWALTVLQRGHNYLELQERIDERAFVAPILREIVTGLNRTYTGMMTDDTEALWLAMPPGNVHNQTIRVLEHPEINILKGYAWMPFITMDGAGVHQRPRLILTQRKAHEPLAAIELRPLMFEYIIRVAHGSLPASFSRQCFEELKHFRLKAGAALTALDEEEQSDADLRLVTLNPGSGQLNSSPLTLEETQ